MKKISALFVFATISLFIVPSVHAGKINMEEGLWEITSKMEVPGMPFPMPATTHSQCITEKEMIPQGKDVENKQCKIDKTTISNDTVSWTMSCSNDGLVSKSSGKITYKGKTFDGKIKVTTVGSESGRDMIFTTVMTGKYIGKCK